MKPYDADDFDIGKQTQYNIQKLLFNETKPRYYISIFLYKIFQANCWDVVALHVSIAPNTGQVARL